MGKSTWINAIANYLKFETLEDAFENRAEEMEALIPSSFSFRKNNEQWEIKIGEQDSNENLAVGQSATQFPREYNFTIGNTKVNLIDTPGIGDTRGIDVDKVRYMNKFPQTLDTITTGSGSEFGIRKMRLSKFVFNVKNLEYSKGASIIHLYLWLRQ